MIEHETEENYSLTELSEFSEKNQKNFVCSAGSARKLVEVSHERHLRLKNSQSDQIRNYNFLRNIGMDSYHKKIGQDQQDRLDNAAFGQKAPRRRRKKSLPR
ncbi:MAG: hypothetical protein QNJ58_11680 [Desulfobacterales bacterium]|nr:hypothetical protein [Desulfobacterales bacterium]